MERLARAIRAELRLKTREEGSRHFFRRAVHEPRTDLRELAADVGIHRITQQGSFRLRRQRNLRAALGKPRSRCRPRWRTNLRRR